MKVKGLLYRFQPKAIIGNRKAFYRFWPKALFGRSYLLENFLFGFWPIRQAQGKLGAPLSVACKRIEQYPSDFDISWKNGYNFRRLLLE